MRWLDFLFPPRVDESVIRDVSIDDFLARMRVQLIPDTRPETIGLLPFTDTCVRAAIHEAKYRGNEHAFRLLAASLAEYLRDADDIRTTRFNLKSESSRLNLVVLVPVPLGRARRKERGFNQVEEIAARAARELGSMVDTTLLVRTRETASQAFLSGDARRKNMRGAFKATRRADPSHAYILIDDVITTGATLQAAIDALKTAGALHIIPLALTH